MKEHLGIEILVLVLMNSKYFYLPFINFPTTGVIFSSVQFSCSVVSDSATP